MIYYRKTLFGSGPKLTAVQRHGYDAASDRSACISAGHPKGLTGRWGDAS